MPATDLRDITGLQGGAQGPIGAAGLLVCGDQGRGRACVHRGGDHRGEPAVVRWTTPCRAADVDTPVRALGPGLRQVPGASGGPEVVHDGAAEVVPDHPQ